jgi:hypothetical protein
MTQELYWHLSVIIPTQTYNKSHLNQIIFEELNATANTLGSCPLRHWWRWEILSMRSGAAFDRVQWIGGAKIPATDWAPLARKARSQATAPEIRAANKGSAQENRHAGRAIASKRPNKIDRREQCTGRWQKSKRRPAWTPRRKKCRPDSDARAKWAGEQSRATKSMKTEVDHRQQRKPGCFHLLRGMESDSTKTRTSQLPRGGLPRLRKSGHQKRKTRVLQISLRAQETRNKKTATGSEILSILQRRDRLKNVKLWAANTEEPSNSLKSRVGHAPQIQRANKIDFSIEK